MTEAIGFSITPPRDTELLRLGSMFEAAWARYRTLPQSSPEWDSAFKLCSDSVDRIARIRARSIAGLAVKAAAVRWINEDTFLDETGATDEVLLRTISRDILELERAGTTIQQLAAVIAESFQAEEELGEAISSAKGIEADNLRHRLTEQEDRTEALRNALSGLKAENLTDAIVQLGEAACQLTKIFSCAGPRSEAEERAVHRLLFSAAAAVENALGLERLADGPTHLLSRVEDPWKPRTPSNAV